MSWLTKLLPGVGDNSATGSKVPTGLWVKCPHCDSTLYAPELASNAQVCSTCDFHMEIRPRERLRLFFDADSTQELAQEVEAKDRLKFRDLKRYRDRLSEAKRKTGETEALLVMTGKLKGTELVASAFNFAFMGGSMGTAVGEKFSRACEHAITNNLPHVCFTASGGARMQEGLFSLMQMAKTSSMVARMRAARLPYIVVLTNPTYGGVTASLAMLGDIILAEPRASIGFAGRRVIEQTVREKLPDGFQTSEFIYSKGAVDMIVLRQQMRDKIHTLLQHLHRPPQRKTAEPAEIIELPAAADGEADF